MSIGAAVWSAGGLEVSVRPHLGLVRPDGGTDVLWLYLKKPELPTEAAHGALRLLELHMPAVCPGGTPLVLDVRRGRTHGRPRLWRKRFDGWLEAEAASYATLWRYDEAS